MATRQFLLTVFILFISFLFCIYAEEVSSENFDVIEDGKSCMDLYQAGKDAYLEERWHDCIEFMEKSVQVYNRMKKHITQCRIKCTNEADISIPTALEDVEDLHFYERTLKNTLCLLRCKKKLKPAPLFTFEEIKLFESLKAYDYLQLCYFQKNMLPQAANAAFTFLVANPNHTSMLSNLKFYSTLPEVDINDVVNKEAPNFVPLYIHGSDAYTKEDFNAVIHNFEESLIEYIRAEEECRAFCEGSFDQGWYPEFIASIANHFTFVLRCKRDCPLRLNSLNGERHDDILPSHYHYLQFAYFKVGKLKQACEAAASYLLFYPVDETMLSNIDYYKTQPKVKKEYFKPREEAIKYIQRQHYETKIMDFITNDFIIDDVEEEEEDEDNEIEPSREIKKTDINDTPVWDNLNKLSPPPILKYSPSVVNSDDDLIKSEPIKSSKVDAIVEKENIKLLKAKMKSELERKLKNMRDVSDQPHNNYVVLGEKELNGTLRFLAKGFATWGECNELLQLAQVAAVQGDGYNGKSPHTDHEKFEGVTLGRAALLVYFGLMETKVLDIYLKLSERVKNYVESYFNLKEKLYFTFTHLVCRTAIDSTGLRNQTDLSHAIHADNCNLQANGECIFAPPAYTWRSYSAILYLNDDFEGGEFIFASDIKAANIQSLVRPKCGRLVGFSSGKENLHGVKGVLRGSRCALGLWFTFDHKYQEIERILAEQVLVQVQKQGTISDKLVAELQKHVPTN